MPIILLLMVLDVCQEIVAEAGDGSSTDELLIIIYLVSRLSHLGHHYKVTSYTVLVRTRNLKYPSRL